MNVWLVIPARGRLAVSQVSFAGIQWLLHELARRQITATALVIGDDDNLRLAAHAGFETLTAANQPLGRKWNDGYEHACRHGATHVMPCGSDDWIHPDLVESMLDLQHDKAIAATRASSAAAPDGSEIALLHIPYEGGDGIRLLPVSLLQTVGYRPTDDRRDRAIDGAMRDKLSREGVSQIIWTYTPSDPLHIVDFKTRNNLTPFHKFEEAGYVTGTVAFAALHDHYPADLVGMAANLYEVGE